MLNKACFFAQDLTKYALKQGIYVIIIKSFVFQNIPKWTEGVNFEKNSLYAIFNNFVSGMY